MDLVCVLGASLGTANRGVSALGSSLVSLVRQGRPGAAVSMVVGARSSRPFVVWLDGGQVEVPVVNYRLSPRARFREHLFVWVLLAIAYRALPVAWWRAFLRRHQPLIGAIAGAVLVGDIRGGDSFSDIYGLRRFLMGSLEALAVILVRREIALFPQTYGPYRSWLARATARWILRRASIVLSRDRQSQKTIRELLGESPRVRFCPDVAFSLEARLPADLSVLPPLPAPGAPCLVGLNVNGLMFNGGYSRNNMFGLKLDYRRFLERLVTVLLRGDEGTHVMLVPHTFAAPGRAESDPEACRRVLASVPPELAGRVHLVTAEYDQNEIKGVIGLCDFFIGSRMHACIAALSQGIPAVGVAYSKKFVGVFDSVGAGEWVVDGRTMTNEEALAKTMELFARREEIRPELVRRVKEAQEQLRTVFAELLAPGNVDRAGRPTTA